MKITHNIRKLFWNIGFDIIKYTPLTHPLARRMHFIESRNIDVIFDIGANAGQYGRQLREDIHYSGRLYSFEPLSSAYARLRNVSKGDEKWDTFNYALGSKNTKNEINIAGNSYSSSLLNMLSTHEISAPESRYVGKEMIEVKKVDSIFSDLCKPGDRVYMKIDTQGYESEVLQGAELSLSKIDAIQMELSLIPLYEGEILFDEMCAKMKKKGFSLYTLENGFADPQSCRLLQVDAIFYRQ